MNLIDSLTELTQAYDEGEPDRCADAVQSVLDAFAPVAAERPLHMIVDIDDEQAYGPFTIGQALDWARDYAEEPGLSDEEAEEMLGAAPLSLVTWDMPEPSWPGYTPAAPSEQPPDERHGDWPGVERPIADDDQRRVLGLPTGSEAEDRHSPLPWFVKRHDAREGFGTDAAAICFASGADRGYNVVVNAVWRPDAELIVAAVNALPGDRG